MSDPASAARASWSEARATAFVAGGALGRRTTPTVPLHEAVGRILAEPVHALCDVPHYSSSAMDGWAVRGPGPWDLADAGPADPSATAELQPGEARPIVTGGAIPIGADAVLRSEAGSVEGGRLSSHPTASAVRPGLWPGLHIRPRGEEFLRGDVAIEAGVLLNPVHIAVAASCGADTVVVRARPRVSLVLTGDEVVTTGVPGPGVVRDSFGPQLPSLLGLLGADVVQQEHLADDVDAVVSAVTRGAGVTEMIVTTGGTGSSAADHLRGALARMGADILVDGIAMRPGAPSMLARLPDGRLLVALPGNPLAAVLSLLTLASTAIAGFAGTDLRALESVPLAGEIPAGRGATRLIPFRRIDGRAVASDWTGSAMLRGLAGASGVLVCGPEGAAAGSRVDFIALPWPTD